MKIQASCICLLAAALSVIAIPLQAQSCPLQNRFDQCIFLTTHNAFASWADGWVVHAQQGDSSVADQLGRGVRGFMLDVYAFDDPTHDRDIYLCHEGCRLSQILKPGHQRRLAETLEDIRIFLEGNPAETVTLIFESYVEDENGFLADAFSNSGTTGYLFQPHQETEGWLVSRDGWPTIQWMIEKNKRLVVLSSEGGPGKMLPYQWEFTVENVFGDESLDDATWCDERQPASTDFQATPRSLYVMNHFPGFKLSPEPHFATGFIFVPFVSFPIAGFLPGFVFAAAPVASRVFYDDANRYDNLQYHVDSCRTIHAALPTFPNFLAVDFYDASSGDPVTFVRDQTNGAPVMQGLLAPSNGLATNNPRPAFTWSAMDPEGNNLTYTIQIDDDPLFGSPVVQQSGLTDASFTPSSALTDGVYFWRARACDDIVGCGPYISPSHFQIDTVPPMVQLTRPNGGEILPASGPSFFDIAWVPCADNAGGSGLPGNPMTLTASLDGGATFSTPIATQEANDGLFPDWNTPDFDGPVSVQVGCVDNAGNVATDASDASFTVLAGKVFMNNEDRILIVNPDTGKFGLTPASALPLCSGVGASQKPPGLIVVPDRECPQKQKRRIHVLVQKVGGPATVILNEPGPPSEKLTLSPVS